MTFPLHLAASAARTCAERMRGAPRHPDWSFGYEIVARALKSYATRVAPLDWPAQRRAWSSLVRPSPVLRRLRFESAAIGGVPGEWFIPDTAADSAPVVVYYHGGSFIYGSPKDTHRELIARHAIASRARVFAPTYRLAPESPFPAAIDDALATYRGLLDSGMPGSRIVLAGESAGGNLAAVTLLRARDAGLPRPAGAALICPYVDQTARTGSMLDNERYDYAEPSFFDRWTETYLQGHDPRDPLASPAFADFRGLPPLLVQVGGCEMLLDQVTAFVARAKAAGVRVDFQEYAGMIHNWHTLASMFHTAQDALDQVGAFVQRAVASAIENPVDHQRAEQ